MHVNSIPAIPADIKHWIALAEESACNAAALAMHCHYNGAVLARHCGVSARTLQRRFRGAFNGTPQAWLNRQRKLEAERRARLDQRTKEIAQSLGYKQTSHFCRHFKADHGMSVKEWRVSAV
jgi:AraC-like DNA-binding protein